MIIHWSLERFLIECRRNQNQSYHWPITKHAENLVSESNLVSQSNDM